VADEAKYQGLCLRVDSNHNARYVGRMVIQSIPATACPKLSARARVRTDQVTGKPVLLYPEGALMLNPTAYAILSCCTGEANLNAIISSLANRYQRPVENVEPQVNRFLKRLVAKNLLEIVERAPATNSS